MGIENQSSARDNGAKVEYIKLKPGETATRTLGHGRTIEVCHDAHGLTAIERGLINDEGVQRQFEHTTHVPQGCFATNIIGQEKKW